MARPETDHHADCLGSFCVDLGVEWLMGTPRHLRSGSTVATLLQLGLSAKQACEAIRLYHLKQRGGAECSRRLRRARAGL